MLAEMTEHIPVLLEESLACLEVDPDGIYVDCTVGLGGHSERILESLSEKGRLIAIDRDREALELARQRLGSRESQVSFHHDNFRNLPLILNQLNIEGIDGCLVDLGVSRMQLTKPDRGFTFSRSGPLDMRMDRGQKTTAEDLVNGLDLEELIQILREYGEEPQAPRIARAIVEARRQERIRTTGELADIVTGAKTDRRRRKIHPATQTFQALRIEVNQELRDLDKFLLTTIDFLKPGGRLVVISFHSLEDRIVKRSLQLASGKCICFRPPPLCACPGVVKVKVLTRKPVEAESQEIQINPSARSARLRAAEKLG